MEGNDRLRGLCEVEIRGEGVIGFTVERQDGERLTVSCPVAELGDVFCFLAQAARAAGEEQEGNRSIAAQEYFAPVPIDGLGFAAGRTPGETLVVANLAGFGLALSMPNSALARFGRDLARTAETLSASTSRKN